MKQYKLYQVDSFAEQVFQGNPAAVVVMDEFLPDDILQKIAAEHNLSETAYIVKTANGFHLRWFTPVSEVDLCGHATLAAAHIIFTELEKDLQKIEFSTEFVGQLTVKKITENFYEMDFPARAGAEVAFSDIPNFVLESLSPHKPIAAFQARDLMLVYENANQVRTQKPDFKTLHNFNKWVIVTAPSDDARYDFISRFYCAGDGIDEDPVTGSAHCTLAPYWAERLGKNTLHAFQASSRGGELTCILKNTRVFLQGKAVTYSKGELYLHL